MAREQTAYKLPPKLLAEFRTETKRAGVTMTSVVEEGIRRWISNQKSRRNRGSFA